MARRRANPNQQFNQEKPRITDIRHPVYSASIRNWKKWRLCYESGDRFIQYYLRKFSKREDDRDFVDRKYVSYVPSFAKKAVNEVRNAVFQRMVDVARVGGDDSYQVATAGQGSGVDMLGASMNTFMGRRVLPELLTMGRVGVYVDMPRLDGTSKRDVADKRPYLYWYPAEDICSWNTNDADEFTEMLLIDNVIEANGDEFYLPFNTIRRYRHVWLDEDGYVNVQLYGDDTDGHPVLEDPVRLNIKKIPFVLMQISDSLLMDAANYQIAHLNLASSDMAFLLKSNFPFYVEQFDPRTQSQYLQQRGPNDQRVQSTNQSIDSATQYTVVVSQDKVHEVNVGPASGRRYPVGANQPAFINPSTDPITASMAKQEQMKQEVRELVFGVVSELAPVGGTPQNSNPGESSLEAGLTYIGLELQHGERQIAQFWASYMGKDAATVNYPESYELKSDADRRKEAADLEELMEKVPSKTFQREIAKRMARVLLGPKVSVETMAEINDEIDGATVVTTDPEVVRSDFESGFVGLDTASQIRGYPAGEVDRAKQDHADRIARIAIAQSKGAGAPAKEAEGKTGTGGLDNPEARGLPDHSHDPGGARDERRDANDPTTKESTQDLTRGEGK